jgi:hypothetical protein
MMRRIICVTLALLWTGSVVAACLPAHAMTDEEMACCKSMAGDCEKASEHSCCKQPADGAAMMAAQMPQNAGIDAALAAVAVVDAGPFLAVQYSGTMRQIVHRSIETFPPGCKSILRI